MIDAAGKVDVLLLRAMIAEPQYGAASDHVKPLAAVLHSAFDRESLHYRLNTGPLFDNWKGGGMLEGTLS